MSMTIRIRREDSEQLLAGLTSRQRQILSLIEGGKSNKDIAYELGIGIGTVKQHIAALFRRLRVTSRTMAIAALRGTRIEVDRKRPSAPETAHFPAADGTSAPSSRPSATWLDVEWRPLSILAVSLGQAERLVQMVGARRFADASARLINGVQAIVTHHGGSLRVRAGLGCEAAFGFGHNGEDAGLAAVQAAFDIFKAQPRDGRDALSNIRVGVASGVSLMRGQDGAESAGWDEILQASFIDTAWSLSLMGVGGLPVACPLSMELASGICFATSLDGSLTTNPTRPVRLSPRRQQVELPPPGRAKSYEKLLGYWQTIPFGRIDLSAMLAPPGYDASTLANALQAELEPQGVVWQELSHPDRLAKMLAEIGKQAPTILFIGRVGALSESAIEALLAGLGESRPHKSMILLSGRDIPQNLREEARIIELSGLDDAEAFLRQLDPENVLSDKAIAEILAQGGNNPLVIEELARLANKSVTPIAGTSLTPRLFRHYLARLDLTGEDRQVLRLASLFINGFGIEDLDMLWPHGRTVLRRSLRRLTETGFLATEVGPVEDIYHFLDPLMQEAVSLSYAKADREELMRRQSRAKLKVSLSTKGQLETT
jgi:DNA-binding CsgD family transcriptional regulator